MLSSVGGTGCVPADAERRARMQLTLFRTRRDAPKRSPEWERLSEEARVEAMEGLARLMAKTIRPEMERRIDER
jgi:hypothetical protein